MHCNSQVRNERNPWRVTTSYFRQGFDTLEQLILASHFCGVESVISDKDYSNLISASVAIVEIAAILSTHTKFSLSAKEPPSKRKVARQVHKIMSHFKYRRSIISEVVSRMEIISRAAQKKWLLSQILNHLEKKYIVRKNSFKLHVLQQAKSHSYCFIPAFLFSNTLLHIWINIVNKIPIILVSALVFYSRTFGLYSHYQELGAINILRKSIQFI